MENAVNFNFPFPTLKQLTLARLIQKIICTHENCRIFPYVTPNIYDDARYSKVRSQIDKFLENPALPRSLKSDILVQGLGSFDQLRYYLEYGEGAWYYAWLYSPVKFDANGVIDQSRSCQGVFESISEENLNDQTLQNLLEIACGRTLLPQISTVLRKVLTSKGAESTVLIGPRKEFSDGKIELSYSFDRSKVPGKRSAYEIFDWLNHVHWNDADVSFIVTERGMEILLDPTTNMDTLKEYFNQLHVTGGLDSFPERWMKRESSESLLFVLKTLNPVDFLKFLSTSDEEISYILPCFLRWPFIQFFMPLLKILDRSMGPCDYAMIFEDIVGRIPNKQDFDVFGYGDLLLEFWEAHPPCVRQEIRTRISENSDDDTNGMLLYLDAMTLLFEKNDTLYSRITENMCDCVK